MPVLNGEMWIAEALDSIRHQTFQDFELLIIDDGCTDNSIEIIRSMKFPALRIIQGPRQGLGAALAMGVNFSESEYLARHDQDDLSAPTRLEKQLAVVTKDPNCIVVGTWANAIDESGNYLRTLKTPSRNRSIRGATNFISPFVHSSVVLRRQAVLRAGNYRASPATAHAEDYDLWVRMAPLGDMQNLNETLVSYRIHPASITAGWTRCQIYPGQCIALSASEATLGRRLNISESELFTKFFTRSRIRVTEIFRLYRLLLLILLRSDFPPPLRALTWRQWMAPLAMALRSSRPVEPRPKLSD